MASTLVQSAVDWLSMSVNRPAWAQELLDWRDARFEQLGTDGYVEKRYSAHGYSYRSRGAVSCGVGAREVLLQLTGAEASSSWRHCARWATNVSRIDLACSARPDRPTSALARQQYQAASGVARGRGRPTRFTLIVNEDRGDTLYVGARTSDQLGRLYDKWRESRAEEYRDCWRWEVQYRRAPALSAVRSLLASETEPESIAATVATWFSGRGVDATYHVGSRPLAIQATRPQSDNERWLAWARRCVAPRAKELAKVYGWRFLAETLCGHIDSFEAWETLVRGVESELVVMEGN